MYNELDQKSQPMKEPRPQTPRQKANPLPGYAAYVIEVGKYYHFEKLNYCNKMCNASSVLYI